MSSRNRSEELLDIRLQHTLKNWVARKDVPKGGREQLLAAATRQREQEFSDQLFKQRVSRLFNSNITFSDRSVFPGYVSALDSVYAIKASMTIA